VDLLVLLQTPRILKLFPIVVAVGALVSFLALPRTFFMWRRCASKDRRWTKDNRLTEVARDDRIFFKGPFFGEAGGSSVVFRAEFRDAAGSACKAFLRCGNHARGFPGHHDLDVRRDD
jgi:hypothetical protein